MIEGIVVAFALLAVVIAGIRAVAAIRRESNTAEKEDGMLLFPSAAGEMARAIRAKQEEERSRKS